MEEEDAEVIDATGRYVIPGGVDVHTHMDLQSGKYRAVDDFMMERWQQPVEEQRRSWITWRSARRDAAVASGGRISSSGRWEISH